MPKITPFLWFDTQAEEAANFYVSVFPNSRIVSVDRYPIDPPQGPKAGDVMTVSFELDGHAGIAMNGGPAFTFDEAVSFVIDCEDQDEVDRYWTALTADGGKEVACGWLKDKYGLSWQVTPRQLIEWTTGADREAAARVFKAMMTMVKIDVAGLKAAYEG
jgi:predicted 3-demethylubiquinone-9 3-methyltransferase (glyoxalase superfamily)